MDIAGLGKLRRRRSLRPGTLRLPRIRSTQPMRCQVIVDTYTVSNGCCNLVTAVDSFIGDNFSKISASPNFLEYSLENVKTLKIDNLRELWRCPGPEEEIFKAVINRIKHDLSREHQVWRNTGQQIFRGEPVESRCAARSYRT